MTTDQHRRCSRRLCAQSQPFPRFCAVCGLLGPCRDTEFAGGPAGAAWGGGKPTMPTGPAPAVYLNNDALKNPALTFMANDGWVVRLHFDPPSVELNPRCTWDDAAKAFWNGVAAVRGLPALFPAEQERAP